MRLFFSYILVFVYCVMPIHAQTDTHTIGAHAWGAGNTSCTLVDVWAVGNNPAGIASLKTTAVGLSYQASPLMLGNFNTVSLALAQPLRKGVLGMQISKFGDKVYNETKFGLAYAYAIEKVRVALKINYLQISQNSLGNQGAVAFEFGAQLPLNKYLQFGVQIYNFSQSNFKDYVGKQYSIPTTIKAGLAYLPIDALSVFVEVEKALEFPVAPRIGLAYKLHKNVTLRTGLQGQGNVQTQTQTITQFAGIGFKFKHFQFDYALASQTDIGLGHQMGLSYK